MIFSHGFYHADPHPGNILLMADNVIGLLDFGMVGRIDEQMIEAVGEMLVAVGTATVVPLLFLVVGLTNRLNGAAEEELEKQTDIDLLRLTERVEAVAGPWPGGGVGDEMSAHRVQFDVAIAGHEITIGIDETRAVTAVP